MTFLSFFHLGLGVYNGADLILYHDHGDRLELVLKHENTFEVTDPDTMNYVRAYGTEKAFFALGTARYNPVNVHHVNIDPDGPLAYVVDWNGDSHEHNVASEIGELQAASASFVWQPTAP